MTHGAADFSWHDNLIYGLHLEAPDPDSADWRSNLVLDIDHIVEWVCGTDGSVKFRIAPATLAFHDVTDLRISIDFGERDHPQTLNELSIAQISRRPSPQQHDTRGRSRDRWCIELNWPAGGEISFGGSGFTQTLRADPILTDEQRLPAGSRQR